MNQLTGDGLKNINEWIASKSKDPLVADLTETVKERESIKDLLFNFDLIKKEIKNSLPYIKPLKGEPYFREEFVDDKWYSYMIDWFNTIDNKTIELFPHLLNIKNKHKDIREMFVSVLKPGAIIAPHKAPWKGVVRLLLGIETPNDERCTITVDNNYHVFKDKEFIVFDDTFIHHASNHTNKDRVVLLINLSREMVDNEAQIVLDKFNSMSNSLVS